MGRTLKVSLLLGLILFFVLAYTQIKNNTATLHHLILCSAFKGQILDRGKPVAGVQVERSVSWNMEQFPRLDYTVTDEKGEFQFPEVQGSAEFGLLAKWLHVPTVINELQVHRSGEVLLIYITSKHDYEAIGGYDSPLVELETDLSNKSHVDTNYWHVSSKVLNQANP